MGGPWGVDERRAFFLWRFDVNVKKQTRRAFLEAAEACLWWCRDPVVLWFGSHASHREGLRADWTPGERVRLRCTQLDVRLRGGLLAGGRPRRPPPPQWARGPRRASGCLRIGSNGPTHSPSAQQQCLRTGVVVGHRGGVVENSGGYQLPPPTRGTVARQFF